MAVVYLLMIFVALGFVLGRWYNPDRMKAPIAEEGFRIFDELLDLLTANGWRYNQVTNKVTHPTIADGQPMSITLAFRQLAYYGNQHAS